MGRRLETLSAALNVGALVYNLVALARSERELSMPYLLGGFLGGVVYGHIDRHRLGRFRENPIKKVILLAVWIPTAFAITLGADEREEITFAAGIQLGSLVVRLSERW